MLDDLLETVAEVVAGHVDSLDGVTVAGVLDLAPEEVVDGHVPVRKTDNDGAVVETAEVLVHGVGILHPNDATSTPETIEGAVADLLMSANGGLSGLRGKR